MWRLTCDDILGGWRSTFVVLHHLQFDLVLLAWTQARLLKGGLRSAQGVQNLTVFLFLPAPTKKNNNNKNPHQSAPTTKTCPGIMRKVKEGKINQSDHT